MRRPKPWKASRRSRLSTKTLGQTTWPITRSNGSLLDNCFCVDLLSRLCGDTVSFWNMLGIGIATVEVSQYKHCRISIVRVYFASCRVLGSNRASRKIGISEPKWLDPFRAIPTGRKSRS
jgi:hypothetical protein